MKLDGVDVRAEHLRKPLVDLRLDLAALHDGMVSSMQTIEDKLRHREEVRRHKSTGTATVNVLGADVFIGATSDIRGLSCNQ